MKHLPMLATLAALLAAPAYAQLVEADSDTTEALRQLVLSNGEDCATVTDMQPDGATGVRLTCQKNPDRPATMVYIIAVSESGLSVTKE